MPVRPLRHRSCLTLAGRRCWRPRSSRRSRSISARRCARAERRRIEVHRAAAAHRPADDPPAHRQGARRGPRDRRPARRRSAVLHRQADRRLARLGAGVQPASGHHDHLGRDDRLADAGREMGGRAQLPALQPRRRKPPDGPKRFTTTLQYLRASRGQFTYEDHETPWSVDLPQPRRQHRQPADSITARATLHRRHGHDPELRADVGEHEGAVRDRRTARSTSIASTSTPTARRRSRSGERRHRGTGRSRSTR